MSNKYKVLVTRRIPQAAINLLSETCEIDQWNEDDVIPRLMLEQKSVGKDGILCLLTDKIDRDLLQKSGDQLKVVSTMSVGVDHISLSDCGLKNIKVGYTPDILTSATAELTVGLLLATSRKIVEGTKSVKEGTWGTWKPMWMCGPSLDGSTVGVFGFGRIGQAVVERLRPFNVKKFLFNSSTKKSDEFQKKVGADFVSFDELLDRSDFLISCCALNDRTQKIFNKEAFEKMKKSSVFVNIARGGVVNQEDLYHALSSGGIGAAGLDVTDPEPLPCDHQLLTLDNCVITPHIGSASHETREQMGVLAARNLLAALRDEKMPAPYHLA